MQHQDTHAHAHAHTDMAKRTHAQRQPEKSNAHARALPKPYICSTTVDAVLTKLSRGFVLPRRWRI